MLTYELDVTCCISDVNISFKKVYIQTDCLMISNTCKLSLMVAMCRRSLGDREEGGMEIGFKLCAGKKMHKNGRSRENRKGNKSQRGLLERLETASAGSERTPPA